MIIVMRLKKTVCMVGVKLIKYPEFLEWLTVGLLAGIWVERIVDYFYIIIRWPYNIVYMFFFISVVLSVSLSLRLREELKSNQKCIYRNENRILEQFQRLFGRKYNDPVKAHFELYWYSVIGGRDYSYCIFDYFDIGKRVLFLGSIYFLSLIAYAFLKTLTPGG